MSSQAATLQPDAAGPPDPPRAPVVRRSFMGRIGLAVLGRWGTRLGLVWLGLMVFLAVFSPIVASSHPILLIDAAGAWTSPMLRHLTWVDVTLLIGTVTAITLCLIRGWSMARRWRIGLAVVVLTTVGAWLGVQPPEAVVYSRYREALTSGDTSFVLNAPIPYSPNDRLRDRSTDLSDHRLQAPSAAHWMGTTKHGEDLLSRMIHASRIALSIGFIATGIAIVVGVIVGGVMGYCSGWVDLLGMRLVEVFSAIPTIFLLIMCVAMFGRDLYLMMIIIGLTGWVGYALFIRAEFLKLRQQDFVQAAKACGLPWWSVLFRHMLPNGATPVLVEASFGVASAILVESVLSFLGLGLVEEPSWGQMLDQARVGGVFHWWMAIFPGAAIFLTVFAYNLIGEALRDAIDPRLQQQDT